MPEKTDKPNKKLKLFKFEFTNNIKKIHKKKPNKKDNKVDHKYF